MTDQILIVDDQPEILSILRRMLEGSGYEVTLVANGQEAIRELREKEYSLVISDILMPALDGLELIIYLRKEKPDVKIIAMSGTANQLYLQSARKLGASEILEKPFTMDKVISTVSEVLEK